MKIQKNKKLARAIRVLPPEPDTKLEGGIMAKQLKKGDKVSWQSSQGKIEGTVEKKVTKPTKIKGHKVAASAENPEIIVKSSKTGAKAAHKPGSLRKKAS